VLLLIGLSGCTAIKPHTPRPRDLSKKSLSLQPYQHVDADQQPITIRLAIKS
jgi:hypothetical protein